MTHFLFGSDSKEFSISIPENLFEFLENISRIVASLCLCGSGILSSYIFIFTRSFRLCYRIFIHVGMFVNIIMCKTVSNSAFGCQSRFHITMTKV